MRKHISQMPIAPKRGDKISHSLIGALMRMAKAEPDLDTGFFDEGTLVTKQHDKAISEYCQVQTTEPIPEWSIFGVTNVAPPIREDRPVRFRAARTGLTKTGSPLLMFTNEGTGIPAGSWGTARPLNAFEVARVTVTGSACTPGLPCGPDLDNWGVCGERFGYICIDTYSEGANYADIMVCPEPCSVIGEVHYRITPYKVATRTLGWGTMKVLYRENNERELKQAPNPATGNKPWLVDVYNICATPVEVGEEIIAKNCMGVGLVVEEPCPESSSLGSVPGSASASGSVPTSASGSIPGSASGSIPGSASGSAPCVPLTGVFEILTVNDGVVQITEIEYLNGCVCSMNPICDTDISATCIGSSSGSGSGKGSGKGSSGGSGSGSGIPT